MYREEEEEEEQEEGARCVSVGEVEARPPPPPPPALCCVVSCCAMRTLHIIGEVEARLDADEHHFELGQQPLEAPLCALQHLPPPPLQPLVHPQDVAAQRPVHVQQLHHLGKELLEGLTHQPL
eukprot:CAMPEP_0181321866 /NCGR_PEP_ID=MMETSP1101-20121128/18923_1 /TAXON_ID=46948 /ORGANISM="Rhodomonas abbreviata, Strain Caron Lab Isolate" /LENGTH=122 /DNA_ID=CAMNT_0023429741 /DNA_START=381 /DNA_END=747 /DNA_ORIENTATION=+